MEVLPEMKVCNKDGVVVCLLKRVGDIALVCSYLMEGNHFNGFEVHRVMQQKAKRIEKDGVVIQFKAKEMYSSATRFGYSAWAYPSLKLVYMNHPQFKPYHDEIVKKHSGIHTEKQLTCSIPSKYCLGT